MTDGCGRGVRAGAAILLVVTALAASACSRSPALPGAANPADLTAPDPVGGGWPCGLLDVQDVELALNVTLAGTTTASQVRPAVAGMEMCGVRVDGSSAAWGMLSKGAAERYHQYERWNGPYLDARTVDGRPALWDGRLRTLVVLDGSRAFAVRLTVARPPLRKDADPQRYVERSATRLASHALRRMPK